MLTAIICQLFGSCAIEKRHFRKGFYVEWHSLKRNSQENLAADKSLTESALDEKTAVPIEDELRNEELSKSAQQEIHSDLIVETESAVIEQKTSETKAASHSMHKNQSAIDRSAATKYEHSKRADNRSWPYLRFGSDIDRTTLLAMIFLLLALFPLSVYLMDDFGEQFNISIFLYIGIIVFGLIALILSNYIVLYYIFGGLSFSAYALGFYHALREIIRGS